MAKYNPSFTIYKPTGKITGGAMRLTLAKFPAKDGEKDGEEESSPTLMIEMAKQTGERSFNWACKIIFALSPTDAGKIILLLEGKVEELELFHDTSKSPKGQQGQQKVLRIVKGKQSVFYVTLTFKDGDKTTLIGCPLNADEIVLLSEIIKSRIPEICGF